MEIKTKKTFSVEITEKDIWEMVFEKIKVDHPNAEITKGEFSVKEKVVRTTTISNTESDDIMEFSHLIISGIITE